MKFKVVLLEAIRSPWALQKEDVDIWERQYGHLHTLNDDRSRFFKSKVEHAICEFYDIWKVA